ncbi:hypothetical protein [Persicobacter sp. CCB-QB2]|uniref:hypothetical protein n=1 Tax=Persicobacter sp. CCB-QB2 TaxID=1561025 RepID=UPI0006A94C8D|nr:hypothetical protein [Persicobacter sp. CCB-QB2]
MVPFSVGDYTSGNIVANYDGNKNQKEIPLYGSGPLGIRFVDDITGNNSTNVFEYKDHLGPVRAHAFCNGESMVHDQWRVYYPFGLQMARDLDAKHKSRFGYQGDFPHWS